MPDEFDDAFDEAGSDKAADTDDEKKSADADDDKPDDDDKDQDSTEDNDSDEKDSKDDDDDSSDDFEQKWKTLQGSYNAEKKKREAAEARILELEQAKKPDENKKDETKDDDDPDLAEYLKDYGHIANPQQKLTQRQIEAAVTKALEDYKKSIEPRLTTAERVAQKTHYDAILSAHSDFEDIRDSGRLFEWIDQQPVYLRKTFKNVVDDGSTEEVIDLFTRFKKESGYEAKKDDGNDAPDASEKKKKLKAMEAVKSKDAKPATDKKSGKADDFDGSFDEAAAA